MQSLTREHVFSTKSVVEVPETLLKPGNRPCLEGNNQKQADFLSRSLAEVNPERVHDLHLLLSVLGRPGHIAMFERGIATLVDSSFSGPQALRLAQMGADRRVRIEIHPHLAGAFRSQEKGLALEKARKRVKRGNTVESVAAAHLEFAGS